MHRLFTQASEITREVIGSAIEVHREKGPGLLESIYEWFLKMELGLRGYQVKSQESVVVHWKQSYRQLRHHNAEDGAALRRSGSRCVFGLDAQWRRATGG